MLSVSLALTNNGKKCILCRGELLKVYSYRVSDVGLRKAAVLAQKLHTLQHSDGMPVIPDVKSSDFFDDSHEFGADLAFHAPSRFVVDISVVNGLPSCDECYMPHAPLYANGEDKKAYTFANYSTRERSKVNLRWLKNVCESIVKQGGSLLSGDELAVALCRVIESEKTGDEVKPFIFQHAIFNWRAAH